MSNTITVTVELGPESQAKLDKILAALEGIGHHNCKSCVETAVGMVIDANNTDTAPAEEPEEDSTPEPTNPAEEATAPVEPEPATEPEAPQYTKEDIQALVRKLAAPSSPETKRAGAKAIVQSYGTKVSDIPVDKYTEVMDKLTALDKEGKV